MSNKIIVLTSELGSGARLVGKSLSEKLNIAFYGEEDLLIRAAHESGLDEAILKEYDKQLVCSSLSSMDSDLSKQVFQAYSDTIFKLVEAGPCILMERGADIILKGRKDFLSVYTYTSNSDKKIERCIRVGGITAEEAPAFIEEQSLQRERYYQSFSDIKRGKMNEYDICLNTDVFTEDALDMTKCVDIIAASL
ncbi:cytidylate kinase-like family protein [Oceanobacillus neutriphilus]|uniref:Cytidylate kinase n=1 Tax=Oceanobacillus neutriphilus TaxID=531815 RepID=A0ABQ2NPE8_9BACI|nr:cytidylate kinase-like family protein [Oceanobacillus neutriphilus]GGP08448.1 hypothetical protein GCM10011346_08530 [Oceanobacillus neutriphilus]